MCTTISALFRQNPKLYGDLREQRPRVLARLEQLLESAAALDICGHEKLVSNAGGALRKLEDLVVELALAVEFARDGSTAELLPDGAFGAGTYTPDLRVASRLGLELLVEVTHLTAPDRQRAIRQSLRGAPPCP